MSNGTERLHRKVEYGMLASFYAPLLTETQLTILRLYCCEDLSYGEIAQQLNISRQGVSSSIFRSFDKLDQLEKDFKLSERFFMLSKADTLLDTLKVDSESVTALQQVKDIISTILNFEEGNNGV
ncbi:MAG: sigma factor-like helix-turn-helix DNA-binding protein [Eubacteriales bacterium]|nr:sigma factor-like helix-turn-helix DNA-binding protein [Eubacteriales bacterium]